jgi:hypothetical protein
MLYRVGEIVPRDCAIILFVISANPIAMHNGSTSHVMFVCLLFVFCLIALILFHSFFVYNRTRVKKSGGKTLMCPPSGTSPDDMTEVNSFDHLTSWPPAKMEPHVVVAGMGLYRFQVSSEVIVFQALRLVPPPNQRIVIQFKALGALQKRLASVAGTMGCNSS